MESYVICFISVDTAENAVNIALDPGRAKIVACANIINQYRSIFWWQGNICDERMINRKLDPLYSTNSRSELKRFIPMKCLR